MDYQRNGWFRPTCAAPCRKDTPYPHNEMKCSPATADESDCTWHMEGSSLSMVVSPKQSFHKLYDPAKALSRGTLFAELDKPFAGKC